MVWSWGENVEPLLEITLSVTLSCWYIGLFIFHPQSPLKKKKKYLLEDWNKFSGFQWGHVEMWEWFGVWFSQWLPSLNPHSLAFSEQGWGHWKFCSIGQSPTKKNGSFQNSGCTYFEKPKFRTRSVVMWRGCLRVCRFKSSPSHYQKF